MTEIKDITGKLLHIIVRKDDLVKGRTDICPPNQFLQCAALILPVNKTFRPHKHLWREGVYNIPQESWVVISGNVEVILYDTNNVEIHRDILTPGDLSITFEGGHNYEILSEDSLVYEFKTGPYNGQENDKVFI